MKIYIFILFLGFFLVGCAKKSYVLDTIKASQQTRVSKDIANQKKSEIIDKTITIINKQMDTSVKIMGSSLIGYIDPESSKNSDTIVDSHFENNDLNLDLHTNKKTGKTRVIATQKLKIIDLKFQEETRIYNDIRKTEQQKSQINFKIETKADSLSNHKIKQSDPVISVASLKKIAMGFVFIIAMMGIVIYLFRKFSIINRVIGWIKN